MDARYLHNAGRACGALLLSGLLMFLPATSSFGYRVIEQLEEAYEVFLDDVTFPVDIEGQIVFRPCGGCSPLSLRVQQQTVYEFDGLSMDLSSLLDAIETARETLPAEDIIGVTIFFDLRSERVNRVLLRRYG